MSLRKPDRGSAVVEFVLMTMILVPLLLGIAHYGLVMHVRNTAAAAAAEGARVGAAAHAPAEAASNHARSVIERALGERFIDDITVAPTVIDGQAIVVVDVRTNVPALGILGPATSLHVQGHAVQEAVP